VHKAPINLLTCSSRTPPRLWHKDFRRNGRSQSVSRDLNKQKRRLSAALPKLSLLATKRPLAPSASCASRADLSRRGQWRTKGERRGEGSVSISLVPAMLRRRQSAVSARAGIATSQSALAAPARDRSGNGFIRNSKPGIWSSTEKRVNYCRILET